MHRCMTMHYQGLGFRAIPVAYDTKGKKQPGNTTKLTLNPNTMNRMFCAARMRSLAYHAKMVMTRPFRSLLMATR
jgi:hypothetical protein